jgi:S-ribosylhomocysteine lyase
MKQIASFTINHMKLLPGVYVSRKDRIGNETITTFDIRITRPNYEPVMQTKEVHAIEHLGATFLRNQKEYADQIIYFGPMGCRTGFYLLFGKDCSSLDIVPLITEMFEFIRDYEGDIPGASAQNCGNYSDMDLSRAKYYAKRFLDEVLLHIDDKHLIYPV